MQAFILKRTDDPEQRSAAIGRVCGALEELEHTKNWRIEVSQEKSERSLAQNAYLFGVVYNLISEKTGYEPSDLHDYLLGKHFGTKLKRVPKSKYNPEGLIELPVRTTTTNEHGRRSVLGKTAFSEYVEFVRRFAAEKLNLVIPDPDPLWKWHQENDDEGIDTNGQ